jgi:GNAT superfamily N-acetyltransferase
MKRLYAPERFQGKGIGRRLSDARLTQAATHRRQRTGSDGQAATDGFTLMRLDTGKAFTEAINL